MTCKLSVVYNPFVSMSDHTDEYKCVSKVCSDDLMTQDVQLLIL